MGYNGYLTGYIFGCGSMVLVKAFEGTGWLQIVALVLWCTVGSTVNAWLKKHYV